jgi:hypothetical protein
MHPEKEAAWVWPAVIGVVGTALASVAGAALLKFADLPTRVSVVETQVSDVKSAIIDIQATVHQIADAQTRRAR